MCELRFIAGKCRASPDERPAWIALSDDPTFVDAELVEAKWEAFTHFTVDGQVCLSNNVAERALRGIALGRRSWTFAGSDRGADRCAFMLTLINTAKLNDIDPQAWLADVLARIADLPSSRLSELLPWNWPQSSARLAA